MVDRLVNSEANARRIALVENCFGTSGQPLAIQGRALVGEGVLTKMCRKKAKPRQFFLFNDILVYGNIVMDKKKYNKQHIIPLEEVKLENLEDDGILKNGWLIRTPTKSFAVYAATATEKTEWMNHINRCVEDLLKKTGKKPSLEHAAVWIPDAEASICMHCRKTQFTVINRRHHCRKCGAVVCNPCSSKKFLLPAQSSKPLRVCLSCYSTLSKARSNMGDVPYNVASEKTVNQDSSGEDDSEDEGEESKSGSEGIQNLSIDEKPTFYGDVPSDDTSRAISKESSATLEPLQEKCLPNIVKTSPYAKEDLNIINQESSTAKPVESGSSTAKPVESGSSTDKPVESPESFQTACESIQSDTTVSSSDATSEP